MFALPVGFSHQAAKSVSGYRISRLSNSKSHRTLVRWDFPTNIIIEPDASVLHVGRSGKYLTERPVPTKNFVFR